MSVFGVSLRFILCFQLLFASHALAQVYEPPSSSQVHETSSKPDWQQSLQKILQVDIFQLFTQKIHAENAQKLLNLDYLQIRLINSNSENMGEVSLGDSQLYAKDLAKNFLLNDTRLNNSGFEIVYEGKKLNSIFNSIAGIGLLGNYLIFLQTLSYDSRRGVRTISFIDLSKFKPGQTALPIFRLPVSTVKDLKAFGIFNHKLTLNGQNFTKNDLKEVSQVQESALHMLSNLSDPKTYQDMIPLLEGILNYSKAIKGKPQDEKAEGISKEMLELFDLARTAEGKKDVLSVFSQNPNFKKSVAQSADNIKNMRGFLGNFNMFMGRLSLPRVDSVESVRESLTQLAIAVAVNDGFTFKEAVSKLNSSSLIKYGLPLALGSTIYLLNPEAVHLLVYEGFDTVRMIVEGAYGKLHDGLYLAGEAAKATFAGFVPNKFSEVYISGGRLTKTLTGSTALFGVLAATLMIPHVLINTFYLAKDSLTWDWSVYNTKNPYILFKNFLIDRANLIEAQYVESLAEFERQRISRGVEPEQWTESDHRFVEELVKKAREKDFKNSKIMQYLKRFQGNRYMQTLHTEQKIQSFGGALAHFFFSYSSFTNSGKFYAKFWNFWFIARSMVFQPRTILNFFFYPKFFSKALLTTPHELKIPTKINGGRKNTYEVVRDMFYRPEKRREIQKWEKEILQSEGEIHAAVLKKSFSALVEFSGSRKDFNKTFEALKLDSYVDELLFKLNLSGRLFFRNFFHQSYEASMKKYLEAQYLSVSKNGVENSENINSLSLKKLMLNNSISPSEFVPMDIEALVEQSISEEKIFEKVKTQLAQGIINFDNVILSNNHKVLKNINPKTSSQLDRFAVAEKQLNKPPAVARAVRSSLATMIVDKPIELAMLFVMVAGATGGFVEPVHDAKFSENSWFYLSRNQFLNGYVSGLIIGFFSEIWFKLQMDDRLDAKGGFDKVPKGELAKKSYLHNFRKALFDKDNTWWTNQKYYTKLIWANMGAAIVTYGAVNFMALGRFDLDAYIGGYLLSFLLPLGGWEFKLENAFEKSTKWVLRDFPEKYFSHPTVIRYVNESVSKLRIRYNIFYALYENSFGHYLANFKSMSTSLLGSRSFSRLLVGSTWTGLVTDTMDNLAEKHPKIFSGPAKLCHSLFTKNFTDK